MDNLGTATSIMRPNCYMTSVVLKDADYTVPVYCSKMTKFFLRSVLMVTVTNKPACLMT